MCLLGECFKACFGKVFEANVLTKECFSAHFAEVSDTGLDTMLKSSKWPGGVGAAIKPGGGKNGK